MDATHALNGRTPGPESNSHLVPRSPPHHQELHKLILRTIGRYHKLFGRVMCRQSLANHCKSQYLCAWGGMVALKGPSTCCATAQSTFQPACFAIDQSNWHIPSYPCYFLLPPTPLDFLFASAPLAAPFPFTGSGWRRTTHHKYHIMNISRSGMVLHLSLCMKNQLPIRHKQPMDDR